MKSEDDPITDDEWLLRRVRVERFRSEETPLISPNAFEPRIKGREPDINGISLYRLDCVESPEVILATIEEKFRGQCGVAKVQVQFIKSLKCSVKSDPVDNVKGHVVIPEINSKDYAAEKSKYTSIKFALAVECSKIENVLIIPDANMI